jgi:hypothetical protein
MPKILKDRDNPYTLPSFSQNLRFKTGIVGAQKDKKPLLLEKVHVRIVVLWDITKNVLNLTILVCT